MIPREIMLELKQKDICGQLTSSSGTNLISQTFSHGSCGDWIHTLRNEVNLPPHTNTKINFKCVKGLTL